MWNSGILILLQMNGKISSYARIRKYLRYDDMFYFP